MPTTITKKATKKNESTFFTIAYNGKELGRIGVHNIFTTTGAQGVRIVWQEHGKGFDAKTQGIVYEYTDRDQHGNIIHSK